MAVSMAARASAIIGQRLLSARSHRKLTMAELANKAQLSPSAINLIEKGRIRPTDDTVEALAEWLGSQLGKNSDFLRNPLAV
jgi:transcriptional regulator with XRE-family HTH domain